MIIKKDKLYYELRKKSIKQFMAERLSILNDYYKKRDDMIRREPKQKFVIHCKETKYYMVEIEADNYDQAVKKWEAIAKRRDYTTLHREMETQSVSQEV